MKSIMMSLLFFISPLVFVDATSIGVPYVEIKCELKDKSINLKDLGARFVERYGIYIDYNSHKEPPQIENFVKNLDKICRENVSDLKAVFREKALQWVKTGYATFEPYTQTKEVELNKERDSFKYCTYRDFEKIGAWMVIGAFDRKSCTADLITYALELVLLLLLVLFIKYLYVWISGKLKAK